MRERNWLRLSFLGRNQGDHNHGEHGHEEHHYGCKEQKRYEIWFLIILTVFLIGLNVYFLKDSLGNGIDAVNVAYEEARNRAEKEMEETFYQLGYSAGETDSHVKNKGIITVESMKEVTKLEVLEASDVEFVFQGPDQNDKNIMVWLEVPGTGVFTVDLQIGEFIVDQERNYILVRVPEPELSECRIDYGSVKKLRFKNDMFNDSIAIGENVAKEMLKDGYLLIQKEFAANERYSSLAKTSAENLIRSMIKGVNRNVEDLQIDVEFVK